MGEINVPGIGTVKVAGEQPSREEYGRIAAELKRRGKESQGTEGMIDERSPSGTVPVTSVNERVVEPFDPPVPETGRFKIGKTINGADLYAQGVQKGQRPDLIYDGDGNVIGYVDLRDYRYRIDPNLQTDGRIGMDSMSYGQYRKELSRRMASEPWKLPARSLDPDARDRRHVASGFTRAAEEARTELKKEFADMLGTTAEFGLATMGSFAGMGIKGAGLLAGGARLGLSTGGAALGGGTGRAMTQGMRSAAEGKPITAEAILEAFKNGATDHAIGNLIIGGAFAAMRPIGNLIVRGIGRAARVASPEAIEIAANARRLPTPQITSAAEINAPFTQGVTKMFGVFPLISGIFRQAGEVRALSFEASRRQLLDNVSSPMKETKLAKQLMKNAENTFQTRKDLLHDIYENAAKQLEGFKLTNFPAYGLRRYETAVDEIRTTFSQFKRELPKEMRPADADKMITTVREIDDTLRKVKDLGREVSYKELQAVQKELDTMLTRVGKESDALSPMVNTVIARLEDAFVRTLSRPNLRLINNPQHRDAFDAAAQNFRGAEREYSNLRLLVDSTAGRPFLLTDKNFFKAGYPKPGTREWDEAAGMLAGNPRLLSSPEYVLKLRELVGQDGVHSLMRLRLEKVLTGESMVVPQTLTGTTRAEFASARRPKDLLGPGTTTIQKLDAAKVRDTLKLGDTKSATHEALETGLYGTGVKPKHIDDLLRRLETISDVPVPNSSTFLGRHIVFGGMHAVASGFLIAGNAVSAGGLVVGTRQLAKLLTTQNGLRILRDGIKPNLGREELIKLVVRTAAVEPSIVVTDDEGRPIADSRGRITAKAVREYLDQALVKPGTMNPRGPGETLDVDAELDRQLERIQRE